MYQGWYLVIGIIYIYIYIAQLNNHLPAMWETRVQSLGWEESLEKGKDYSLQYSGLENSMNSIVQGVTRSWTQLSDFHFHFICINPTTTVFCLSCSLSLEFPFHSWTCYFGMMLLCYAKLLKSCLTLCDPINSSLPGSSVTGILQTRILEWVAMPSSRGSSQPRDRICITYVSCIGRRVLYH